MKIAIIGSGIAGNVAAYHLHREHDITMFEAAGHIGGHSHTDEIEHEGQQLAVDTGFIVFNHRTYPLFKALLEELGVASQASEMSFSVQCEVTGVEYNGTTLNSLFAQRRLPHCAALLAPVHRAVRRADGRCDLEREPGDAATVSRELPGAVLSQPRDAVGQRSAAVAHDPGRLGTLRGETHRAIPRPDQIEHARRVGTSNCGRRDRPRRRL
jgi:glycine/D-amino acid oxidase-like deaminating enzyme